MTHEELKSRIRRMPYDAIMLLTGKEMWKLTDCFDEELVREIVAKHRTPKGQRDAIRTLKTTRIKALQEIGRPVTGSPKYFEDWVFDIKTGVLVEGAPPVVNEIVYNIQTKKSAEAETTDISKYKALLAEKDAEIASLKQQPEECQNNDSYNDEQEAKQDEKVLYNKVSHEFFLRLLEKAGLDLNNTGNKTRVGDLWHMVTGKSGDEIRRYCSTRNYINPHTRVDIKRLNEFLQDMKIGDFQLPIS